MEEPELRIGGWVQQKNEAKLEDYLAFYLS